MLHLAHGFHQPSLFNKPFVIALYLHVPPRPKQATSYMFNIPSKNHSISSSSLLCLLKLSHLLFSVMLPFVLLFFSHYAPSKIFSYSSWSLPIISNPISYLTSFSLLHSPLNFLMFHLVLPPIYSFDFYYNSLQSMHSLTSQQQYL